MSLFKAYWHLFRRLKLIHFLNNLLYFSILRKNKALYQKAGVKKSIFSSISSRDFKDSSVRHEMPWIDKCEVKELQTHPSFKKLDAEKRNTVLKWKEDGYLIMPQFFSNNLIDEVNKDIDKKLSKGKSVLDYTNTRVMNAWKYSAAVKSIAKDEKILDLLGMLLGKKAIPFQTINFPKGSRAKAHSDSIHMTTAPPGFLVAIWVALEDIHPESGPLFYYPGSHQLPYITNKDFDTENTAYTIGDNYYENYTGHIEHLIDKKNLQKKELIAEKGDVLIWHANLLHGGSPVINPQLTRKSLVVHYFCEDVICYHEITQRPAIIKAF